MVDDRRVIHGQFAATLALCRGCDRRRLVKCSGGKRCGRAEGAGPRTVCVSTVDYGESLWFHLFHIHEPNGSRCIIHEQIRR